MIMQSFVALLREKKFEKISIQEIADAAMINRATFYAHYADKQALYDNLIAHFLDDFQEILDKSDIIDGTTLHLEKAEEILATFYTFVRENPELAKVIVDKSQDTTLLDQFIMILQTRYPEFFEAMTVFDGEHQLPKEFIVSYISSILVGTLRFWPEDSKTSSADFANLTIHLIANQHLTLKGVTLEK